MERITSETQIALDLELDPPGTPACTLQVDHPFLGHLLAQLQRHGRLGLRAEAKGDVQVDVHHLAEDLGIALGQALDRALGDRTGVARYGHGIVPMDETLAEVVLDLSGRPHLAFSPEQLGIQGEVHGFTAYHLREFLRGLCNHGRLTLHVRLLAGSEIHHVCEAISKALALALRQAVAVTSEELPSTKGRL